MEKHTYSLDGLVRDEEKGEEKIVLGRTLSANTGN